MLRPALSTHWKFQRLARTLGSRALARGVLETLWEPCVAAGDAYVGTSDDIETLCDWRGEPGGLTQALLSAGAARNGAGFIEPCATGIRDASQPHYQIHHFSRPLARRQPAEGVHKKRCTLCGEPYLPLHPKSQFCSGRCRQAAHRGKAPQRQRTRRVGHGRREADPPGLEVEETTPAPEASPIVLTFPVVGQDGPEWHLREDQLERWRGLYPNLDVLDEARQALAWIEADKARRKTAGGMTRFFVSWFNRSVDRPRRGPAVITGSLKTAGNKWEMLELLRERGHEVD